MLIEEGEGLFESARERNKSESSVIRSCSSVSSSTAGDLSSWLILKYAKKMTKQKRRYIAGMGLSFWRHAGTAAELAKGREGERCL